MVNFTVGTVFVSHSCPGVDIILQNTATAVQTVFITNPNNINCWSVRQENYNPDNSLSTCVRSSPAQDTYFSLPRIGDSPMMTEASADLTCWLASDTSSFTDGRMLVMMICSLLACDRFAQNSARTTMSQVNQVGTYINVTCTPMSNVHQCHMYTNVTCTEVIIIWQSAMSIITDFQPPITL